MSSVARIVSLAVLTTLIVFLGITFFHVIAPFLLPLFLAGVLAVLCQPLFHYFIRRTNNRIRVAAGLTTVSVMAVILVPLLVGTILAAAQLVTFTHETIGSDEWEKRLETLRTEWRIDEFAQLLEPVISPKQASNEQSAENADAAAEKAADETPQQKATTEQSRVPSGTDDAQDIPSDVADVPAEEDDKTTLAEKTEASKTPVSTDDDDLTASSQAKVNAIAEQLQGDLRTSLQSLAHRTIGAAAGAAGTASGLALDFLGSMVSLLVSGLMFVIALYYFLADGPSLLATTQGLIPLHAEYQRQLLKQFEDVLRAVVMATFAAAISQGLVTAIAVYAATFGTLAIGFGYFFILFIVATTASLIPLAGTWLVWGPFAVWLFYGGHWIQGSLLTFFGAAVIGTMDNVVRTYVLQNDAKLHPLLAFVSVLGGLKVMGLWGIFVGPIVASCLHALIQIFNVELKELSRQRSDLPQDQAGKKAAAADPVKQPAPGSTPAGTKTTASDNATSTVKKSKRKRPKKTKKPRVSRSGRPQRGDSKKGK
jgi:predicted PurR-regulated permease PerM